MNILFRCTIFVFTLFVSVLYGSDKECKQNSTQKKVPALTPVVDVIEEFGKQYDDNQITILLARIKQYNNAEHKAIEMKNPVSDDDSQ